VASLSSLSLTQKQAATLWLIGSNVGVSQATLAGCLGMDRATMMSVVDRLEENGHIIRRRSLTDRRRQELHLTPLGQNTLKKSKAKIAEHERRFTRRLNQSELATLQALLSKLAGE
jgi:DNA-binding MarR family transcriptional regulator